MKLTLSLTVAIGVLLSIVDANALECETIELVITGNVVSSGDSEREATEGLRAAFSLTDGDAVTSSHVQIVFREASKRHWLVDSFIGDPGDRMPRDHRSRTAITFLSDGTMELPQALSFVRPARGDETNVAVEARLVDFTVDLGAPNIRVVSQTRALGPCPPTDRIDTENAVNGGLDNGLTRGIANVPEGFLFSPPLPADQSF